VLWNTPDIQALIRSALREDSARSDLTTRLLIDPALKIEAAIVSNQKGMVAGLPLTARFFKALDPSVQFREAVQEGANVRPHQRLATIKGKAQSVLSAERPALNALQHLSGIATFTHNQIQKLKGTRAKLYDTRKTLPGWRTLQKYAVRCGGARNQRMSLSDAIMIKENHLQIVRLVKSDWIGRLRRIRIKRGAPVVQMEIQNERDFRYALLLAPPRALLDNLPPKTLKRMTRLLRKAIPDIEIEFTGGVTPANLRALAKLGPDRISMGRLTHSVTAFDCSLDITHVYS